MSQQHVAAPASRSGPDPGWPPPRLVYLGGLGRSGSTLLERLLGELPGVCAAGEVVHMWQRGVVQNELCGCGEPFGCCPFWQEVGQRAFGGWTGLDPARVAGLRARIDRNRHLPLLAAPGLPARLRRQLDEYVGYYLRVYAAIGRASGCGVVVDSSKHASLAFCLRWRPELDLRVVHVIRDPRAVAYSWTRQVSRPEAAAGSFMTTYSPAAAAAHWNTQNAALALLARRGVPTLRVRYEDLACAPGPALARIAEFAGIPAGPGQLAFLSVGDSGHCAQLRAAHTASGNPMRLRTGKIEIRPDERWRTGLPAAQRAVVTALTLPLLARYGYPRRAA